MSVRREGHALLARRATAEAELAEAYAVMDTMRAQFAAALAEAHMAHAQTVTDTDALLDDERAVLATAVKALVKISRYQTPPGQMARDAIAALTERRKP